VGGDAGAAGGGAVAARPNLGMELSAGRRRAWVLPPYGGGRSFGAVWSEA
jgi:hypothetical protein